MTVSNLGELKSYLNSLGTQAKKSLGQNFLIDANILDKIVAVAEINNNDKVLEIGPGPGALTERLLKAGAQVVAVEKDRILAQGLERLKGSLEIVTDDFLKLELTDIVSGNEIYKIVANIPYNITTPILEKVVPHNQLFSKLVFMVQDEVARRCTAKPGSSDYSSLTVFLNFYANVKYAFKVSKNSFSPPPKIDSAIIVLDLKEQPLPPEHHAKFFELTRTAFQHKRKMLRASLRNLYSSDKVMDALQTIGYDPLARPQELSVEGFTLLLKELLQ